jgi:acetoin:2,6-dichlorophenolindophenol oxidoreductase subunit alpha
MTAGGGALARAAAIGVPGVEVDGNDVFAVDRESSRLLKEIRGGKGPRFLHAVTYRFKGHVSVDAAGYRDGAEVSKALQNDPLVLARKRIREADAKKIEQDAEQEVQRAVDAAAAAPWPAAEEAYRDVQDIGGDKWR